VSGTVVITSAVVTARALRVENSDAPCRADRMTLEVAIEAFVASEDRPPESAMELVDAGLIRAPSELHDVLDAEVVPASGSPCATLLTGGRAVGDGSGPTRRDVTSDAASGATERPGACTAVDAAFERLDRVDGASADKLGAELHQIATMIRESRDPTLQPRVRADIVGLADSISGMALIVEQLDEHTSQADAETLATIDALTEAIADYVRVLPTGEFMTTMVPDLAETCGTGFVPSPELIAAVEGFQMALTAFLATDLGRRPEFSMLVDISESIGSPDEPLEPQSSMVSEFHECSADLEASSLGDNEGCDALYRACGDGEMDACDDLFHATFPGTEYSTLGATCAGRAQPMGRGYAGFCEEVDD
jgi:hypothetical protein